MCDPVTIGLSLAAVGTGYTAYTANQAAKAQARAIERQNEIRAEEIADAASVEANERIREGHRERARIRVAAGESGLQGASFEGLLANSLFQQGIDVGLVLKNEANRQRAREAETDSLLAGLQIESPLGIALRMGSAAAGQYVAMGMPKIGKKPKKN